MNLNDITLVIAIDKHHLKELSYTWPTWMKFKPEIKLMKKIVIYDKTQIRMKDLSLFDGHDVRFVPWDMDGVCQREKMLTSFIVVPPAEVTTKWYLKLDVDAIATAPGEWIKDEWFEPQNGKNPVYISHGWSFSKPANVLQTLDEWGDTIEPLKFHQRLNIPFKSTSDRVMSKRIISWCFFGNTEWTKFISKLCGNKLPVASQDTVMYYCATRLGEHTVRTNMKKLGWDHLRLHNLRKLSEKLK
jgi:hypothetical protein